MISNILNSEPIRFAFTVILILGVILMSIHFRRERKKINKLQKYYSNVKSNDFRLSTNDGPNPCENDAEIENYEICGMSETMFLDKKGSL